jgi:hypothetical protein
MAAMRAATPTMHFIPSRLSNWNLMSHTRKPVATPL